MEWYKYRMIMLKLRPEVWAVPLLSPRAIMMTLDYDGARSR
jgi:hypothetical protein